MARFTFSYPATFGEASPGTNNGFGGRSAAIRFSTFSMQGVGGEAVLTAGPPFLDVQAAGGLYDEIAREVLPAVLRAAVLNYLPPLTSEDLCEHIGRENHIELDAPFLLALPVPQREAVVGLDRLGNVSPTVLQCVRTGDVVTFQKMASFMADAPRRLVSGAVRFLDDGYSSFQLIRAVAPTDSRTLRQTQDVVTSWRRVQ